MQPREQLIRLQKRIYQSLKGEVRRALGPQPAAIEKYERAYRKEFRAALRRKSVEAISKQRLLSELARARVVFVGDYHTDPQAQKSALRLLRELHARDRESPWILGIEMIPSQHQKHLDAYLAGKIGLEKFHRAIRYRDEWGFPWEHYAPLFEYARREGIAVVGLNRPKALIPVGPEGELEERDQWAAGVLTDRIAEGASRGKAPRILVLYGELHLASRHLPRALKRIARPILRGKRGTNLVSSATVFLNQDDLYFRVAREGKESQSEILRLASDRYCVLSGTPWGKLQSVINWVEGGLAHSPAPSVREFEGKPGKESDQDVWEDMWEDPVLPDELESVARAVEWICEFLRVKPPKLDHFQVITIREADRFTELLSDPRLEGRERRHARMHWLRNQRIFLAPLHTAYLGSPSANSAAEMAALWILKQANGRNRLLQPGRDGWFELVLESCFGFLGSLISNPKRKCDFLRDHRKRVAALRRGESPTFPEELHARKLASAVLSSGRIEPAATAYSARALNDSMASVLAARWVGKVLAKLLYPRIVANEVPLSKIRTLFLSRSRIPFERRFEELADLTLWQSKARAVSKADSL